ncbi:MAG: hypothetical protein OEX05_09400, partial [Chloroflexota bacterium]|nr:hypothetical protein [Chloroflexota bacterium]
SYGSPTAYVEGLIPAMQLGAVIVAFGAIAAMALPGRSDSTDEADLGRAESPVGVVDAPLATA